MENPFYVNSPLGTRVSVDQTCQDCELEVSGILLTMNLRGMDMSEFDVILRMDWLTAHRVFIGSERRRATHRTVFVLCFKGDKHDALPRAVYDSKGHG